MTLARRPRPKYGNKKVTLDGYTFDSRKEADRYVQLRMLEKAGRVEELEVHPKFQLHAPSTSGYLMRASKALESGGLFKIGCYIADFKYRDGTTVPYVVEDVKSPPTRKLAIYRWKKRHVEAQYGIRIVEV